MISKSCFSIFSLVLLSALSAQTFASGSGPDLLIVHGVTVRADDPIASTTVAVINESGGQVSLCSGSIVASDLILTAGHCVGPDAESMHLAFTMDIHQASGALVPVAGFLRPKDYGQLQNDQDMNDIALIRFDGGLPPGYQVARFLDQPDLLKDGETVTLAGYGVADGHTETDPSDAGAGVLRKVDVRIAQAVYGKTEVVMDQTDGRGACHGDSGGPAFLKRGGEYLLFGVTSRGTSVGSDECGGASIYTSVLAHAKFLREAARELRRN